MGRDCRMLGSLPMRSFDSVAPSLDASTWSVVCLCAAWCGVCKAYEKDFQALAARFPGLGFYCVDVEDEADAMGEVDIETFPTLLLAKGGQVHHIGAMLPQTEVLARHIQSLLASEPAPPAAGSPEANALWVRLQRVLPEAI